MTRLECELKRVELVKEFYSLSQEERSNSIMKEFLGNIDPRSKQIFSTNIALMWLEDFRFKKRFVTFAKTSASNSR